MSYCFTLFAFLDEKRGKENFDAQAIRVKDQLGASLTARFPSGVSLLWAPSGGGGARVTGVS